MIHDPLLLNDWHAVASSAQIQDASPIAARLPDTDLVVWRNGDSMHVWRDLCIHRGSKLSAGRVCDGRLACPYHGWEYDSSGRCLRIPAHPDQPPPTRARATVYAAQERYGLVWVAAAVVLSCTAFIHAFRITSRGIETVIGYFAAPAFALSYFAAALSLVGFRLYATRRKSAIALAEDL